MLEEKTRLISRLISECNTRELSFLGSKSAMAIQTRITKFNIGRQTNRNLQVELRRTSFFADLSCSSLPDLSGWDYEVNKE